jgi:hypothetical protein
MEDFFYLDGVLVCLEDDIKLESLVLGTVDSLFVLGLSRRHKLRVF